MKSVESFVPMGTEERVKRPGVQLEQESSKKQNTVGIEEVPVIEKSATKLVVAKEEEIEKPIKRTGKKKKQITRKGLHADKTTQDKAEEDMEAIEKDNVINSSSGTDIPVSAVLVAIKPPSIANWKIIKLDLYSTDPVWNLPYQQKILSWRYYDTCRVHCLTLESADIYMLTERRYPLPADVCQAMLDKKLQGDNRDKACYQLLKLIEKQAQNKLP
ncbi:hypothetical protein Tco_1214009 [Tanacetum coccineum]